ncbi:MAG: L,D-transpeptidase family protein [Syntrophobacteraceae bacterium]
MGAPMTNSPAIPPPWVGYSNAPTPQNLKSAYVPGDPITHIKVNNGILNCYNNNDQLLGSYTYSSGMNSSTDYIEPGTGPTPPGYYTIYPSEVSPAGFARKYLDPRDWGDYRVPLHPDYGTNTYGRGGFFIHGGNLRHGSEGCIKVESDNQDDLFNHIINAPGPITVIVGPIK